MKTGGGWCARGVLLGCDRHVLHMQSAPAQPVALLLARDAMIQVALLSSTTAEVISYFDAYWVELKGFDRDAMLEPGSLLPSGARVPSGEVYGGSPAAFVRKLSKDELAEFKVTAEATSSLATKHADEFLPYGTLYQLKEEMLRQEQSCKAGE